MLIRINFVRGNFYHTLCCSEAGVKSKLFSNFLGTYMSLVQSIIMFFDYFDSIDFEISQIDFFNSVIVC